MSVLLGTNSIDWEEFFQEDITFSEESNDELIEEVLFTMNECFDELCMDILRYYEKWYSQDSLIVILGYYDDFEVKESGGVITNDLGYLFDFFLDHEAYLYQWKDELLVRVIEEGRNVYYIPHVLPVKESLEFEKMVNGKYDKMSSEKRRLINNTFFYARSDPFFKNMLLVADEGVDIRELL